MTSIRPHPFEEALSVSVEDIEFELSGHPSVGWAEFLLNPRRLRGSDFLMRWSQGVWSEERITEAVNSSESFFAIPYGPSGTAPDNDPRAFELYFERLEQAGLGKVKRPDLLVFRREDKDNVEETVRDVGGLAELPFISEEDAGIRGLLSKAIMAVECENSLWRAKRMPAYGAPLTIQRRLGGNLGLKKSAVLPTVILKDEDRSPLRDWQTQAGVPVHIWHVFYDLAFGISFDRVEELIEVGLIDPTAQTFQAPGGATSKKVIYKIYYHYAYPLGEAREEPKLTPAHIEDKNGHILPFVRFEGGSLALSEDALRVLEGLSARG